jgi:hypothetical protein
MNIVCLVIIHYYYYYYYFYYYYPSKNYFNGKLPDVSQNYYLGMLMANNNPLTSVGSYSLTESLKWLHLYYTKIHSADIEKLQLMNSHCRVL